MEECLEALRKFQEADEWSRSREREGRRIEEVDGGWLILNHAKYREKMSVEEMKEKGRIRQARYRERLKMRPASKEMTAVRVGGETAERLAEPEGQRPEGQRPEVDSVGSASESVDGRAGRARVAARSDVALKMESPAPATRRDQIAKSFVPSPSHH